MKGVLHLSDPDYPLRLKDLLGRNAPKELHFEGNLSLLEPKAIGFCGSRKVSEKGLEAVEDCAKQVVQQRRVVISGNANGVDLKAHYVALKNGGCTILVLPEGLNHFRIKSDLKSVWDWSRVLVLSQFPDNLIWRVYNAMTRNQVIIALSQAMIVIEASEKGGTMHAAKTSLMLNVPLYVAVYQEMTSQAPGNDILLKSGAKSLCKSRKTGYAKIPSLLDDLEDNHSMNLKLPMDQLSLI